MITAGMRVGVGTRFHYDGETVEVVQLVSTAAGGEVMLTDGRGRLLRMSLKELVLSDRARLVADSPSPGTEAGEVLASVVLKQLNPEQRREVLRRAEHVREVLTGYRSGSAELLQPGEPRTEFDPALPLEARYAAKSNELGISARTLKRWVARFRQGGEAGLAGTAPTAGTRSAGSTDERWTQMALEVMVEHTSES